MTERLPALRRNLEMMPSPVADRPGLLVRDPFRYADSALVFPNPLVPCLLFFDGKHDETDLREALVRMTGGDVRVGELMDHLKDTLSEGGFLDDETFARLREARHRSFAEEAVRKPVHAGSGYPTEPDALHGMLAGYLRDRPGAATGTGDLLGIAAPHVSLEGGGRSYGAAYGRLGPELADRTFVILGTSHYGEPDRFGLTRKPFATPFGATTVDTAIVDGLAVEGGPAACLEDYCHAVEHSIEFQVLFLQHLYGPAVRIVPILCGPFARATFDGGLPEDDPAVARFLDALRGLADSGRARLLWVLGVDLAHIGTRYGDRAAVIAETGRMADVGREDRERCALVAGGEAHGFWRLLQRGQDPLRWCGASPLYAFLAAVRPRAGELLRYEQWNIDEQSVVSFAAMTFR